LVAAIEDEALNSGYRQLTGNRCGFGHFITNHQVDRGLSPIGNSDLEICKSRRLPDFLNGQELWVNLNADLLILLFWVSVKIIIVILCIQDRFETLKFTYVGRFKTLRVYVDLIQ
jgi:hypothetical protein